MATSARFALRRPIAAGLLLLYACSAWGHPLGDFSINQYFIVDGSAPSPEFHYLLDVAEIPSFTELDLLDTDFDSEITQDELELYLDQRIPQLAGYLNLTVNGEAVPISVTRHKLILLEGNGGMVVFNILLSLRAEIEGWPGNGPIALGLTSENYPNEQGTRECLLLTGAGFTDTTHALAPEQLADQAILQQDAIDAPIYGNRGAEFTLQLTPGAGRAAPLTLDDAMTFTWTSTARLAAESGETAISEGLASALIDSGFIGDTPPEEKKPLVTMADDVSAETVAAGGRQAAGDATGRLMERMTDLVRSEQLPPLLVGLGLAIALLLGMGHALSPGHGKTVMAAYLIGEQGTSLHAVMLGIVVTLTHTWSVILLGLVTLYFKDWFSQEQVNFWSGILSGAIIVIIGVVLFRRRYHLLLASHQGEAGAWKFFHGHDHLPEEQPVAEGKAGKPPTFWSIFWLGISGGVVPCPAALIVLLLAIKVGKLAYGLALLIAFSIGLALVLVIIGLMVVRAAKLLQRRKLADHPAIQVLPLGSAALITLLGGWVVVWTLLQFDVLRFG